MALTSRSASENQRPDRLSHEVQHPSHRSGSRSQHGRRSLAGRLACVNDRRVGPVRAEPDSIESILTRYGQVAQERNAGRVGESCRSARGFANRCAMSLNSVRKPVCVARRPVPGQLGLEVAEAVPLQAMVEVNFGDDDRAPLFGVDDRLAVVAVDGGQHPVAARRPRRCCSPGRRGSRRRGHWRETGCSPRPARR